LVIVVLLVG